MGRAAWGMGMGIAMGMAMGMGCSRGHLGRLCALGSRLQEALGASCARSAERATEHIDGIFSALGEPAAALEQVHAHVACPRSVPMGMGMSMGKSVARWHCASSHAHACMRMPASSAAPAPPRARSSLPGRRRAPGAARDARPRGGGRWRAVGRAWGRAAAAGREAAARPRGVAVVSRGTVRGLQLYRAQAGLHTVTDDSTRAEICALLGIAYQPIDTRLQVHRGQEQPLRVRDRLARRCSAPGSPAGRVRAARSGVACRPERAGSRDVGWRRTTLYSTTAYHYCTPTEVSAFENCFAAYGVHP